MRKTLVGKHVLGLLLRPNDTCRSDEAQKASRGGAELVARSSRSQQIYLEITWLPMGDERAGIVRFKILEYAPSTILSSYRARIQASTAAGSIWRGWALAVVSELGNFRAGLSTTLAKVWLRFEISNQARTKPLVQRATPKIFILWLRLSLLAS